MKEVWSVMAKALMYKLVSVTICFYNYVFLFRFVRVPSGFYISTIAYILMLLLIRVIISYSKGFPLVRLRDVFNNVESFLLFCTDYNPITIIKVYILVIKGSRKSISI